MEKNLVTFIMLGMTQLMHLQFAVSSQTYGEDIKPTPTFLSTNNSLYSITSFSELNPDIDSLSNFQTLEIAEIFNKTSPLLTSHISPSFSNITSSTEMLHSLHYTQTLSGEFQSIYQSHVKESSFHTEIFPNASLFPKDFVFLSEDENPSSVYYQPEYLTSSVLSSFQSSHPYTSSPIFSTPHATSSAYNGTPFSSSPETIEPSLVSDSNGTTLHFLMIFQSNCANEDNNFVFPSNKFEQIFENATSLNLSLGSNSCYRNVLEVPLNVTIGDNIEEVFHKLRGLIRKFNISAEFNNKTEELTLVNVKILSFYDGGDDKKRKRPFLVDYLPYVIIGAVFGGILLVAFVLICSKCVCNYKKKKRGKRPNYEVPHLSLRPEDYILTRIPRPTTIYSDNMATPIIHDEASLSSGQPCYHSDQPYCQSFETSVVPMEEVMIVDDPYLRYKMHEYRQDDDGGELRTFNGKRLHHRSTETDDSMMYRNSHLMTTPERSHRSSRDVHGYENQAYVNI